LCRSRFYFSFCVGKFTNSSIVAQSAKTLTRNMGFSIVFTVAYKVVKDAFHIKKVTSLKADIVPIVEGNRMKRRDFLKALCIAPAVPSVLMAVPTDLTEEKLEEAHEELKGRTRELIFIGEEPCWTATSGDMYYNDSNFTLYVYSGNEWLKVGDYGIQT